MGVAAQSLQAPASEPNLSGHIPPLDGVRGVAIALVLINNLYPGYPDGFVDRLFYIASNVGWTGVDLFFVLSGFLITGILWDTKHRQHYFRNFYARRFLRIFPLAYGTLLLWNLAVPILAPDPEALRSWQHNQWWYWSYLANVKQALYGDGPLELGHFWSLAVEEQFYLLWPLVVLLCGRRRFITICLLVVAAAMALRIGWRWYDASKQAGIAVYVLTLTRMDGLAIGALLAILARDQAGIARLARWARPVFPIGLLGVATIFVVRRGFISHDVIVQMVGYSVVAIAAGAGLVLAVAAKPGSLTHRFTTHRWMVALGRYSYGIYVLQFVCRLTWDWSFVSHPPKLWGYEFPAATAIFLILSAVAILLGALSWHLFERPILRLKDRFPYDRSNRSRRRLW